MDGVREREGEGGGEGEGERERFGDHGSIDMEGSSFPENRAR